jgi:hypothetical protein
MKTKQPGLRDRSIWSFYEDSLSRGPLIQSSTEC